MKKIKWRRADIILIAALLAVGGIFAVVLLLTTSSGDKVNVRVAGTVTASYPLNQDASYWIDGVNGGRNLLVSKTEQQELRKPPARTVSVCIPAV